MTVIELKNNQEELLESNILAGIPIEFSIETYPLTKMLLLRIVRKLVEQDQRIYALKVLNEIKRLDKLFVDSCKEKLHPTKPPPDAGLQ